MAKLSGSLINKAKVKSKELEQILEQRVEQRRQLQLQQGGGGEGQQDRRIGQLMQIIGCKTEDQASQLIHDIVRS